MAQRGRYSVRKLSKAILTPDRKRKWNLRKCFSVYMICTAPAGKKYIGMTKNLCLRMAHHRHRRPVWFQGDFAVYVLSEHTSAGDALSAEAKAIVEQKSLAPHGHNFISGGALGEFFAKLTPRQRKDAKASFSQAAKDKLALARLAKATGQVKKRTEDARRRTAWKRFRAGLPALPGTEKYLLEPEKKIGGVRNASPELREKYRQAHAAYLDRMRAAGSDLAWLRTQKGRKKPDEVVFRQVQTGMQKRMRTGKTLTWQQIARTAQQMTARQAAGKNVPTCAAIFLRVNLGSSRQNTHSAAWRTYRQEATKKVNAWLKAYTAKYLTH